MKAISFVNKKIQITPYHIVKSESSAHAAHAATHAATAMECKVITTCLYKDNQSHLVANLCLGPLLHIPNDDKANVS